MARYKPSALFEQFRGRIGNSVFTGNRAGNNLRNYVVPSNPQTPNQVFIRDIFSIVASIWFTISTATRSAWTSFANAGYIPLKRGVETLGYTGRQAFSALYTCGAYARDWMAQYDFLNQLTIQQGMEESTAIVLETINPSTNVPAVWSPSNFLTVTGDTATITAFEIAQNQDEFGVQNFQIYLSLDNVVGKSGANTIKIDGQDVGFCIYRSNALKAEGQSVISEFTSKFMVLPVLTSYTLANDSVANEIVYVLDLPAGSINMLQGWYYLTLCAYTKEGQQFPIMSAYKNMEIIST